MNLWYACGGAGLVLALDNAVELVSNWSAGGELASAKERRLTAGIRGVSGLMVMGCAWLVIIYHLFGAGIAVTSVNVWEGLLYALGTAGVFHVLIGLFSVMGFRVFRLTNRIRTEANKGYLGGYMFMAAGFLLGLVDMVPIVSVVFFLFAVLTAVTLHLFIPQVMRRVQA